MYRPLLAALVVILLLPVAAALGGVAVSATARNTGLDIDLDASAGPAAVHVVVTHDDPLAGTVIDRIVRVESDVAAQVTLDDLRTDAAFEVRVLDASIPLPTLPGLDGLFDILALLNLTSVANVSVPLPEAPPTPPVLAHDPYVYLAGKRGGWPDPPRILVTREGHLVVAWLDQRGLGASTDGEAQLYAKLSRDGGHTFQTLDITPAYAPASGVSWSMSESAGGKVAFIVSRAEERAPRLFSLDPRNASVSTTTLLSGGNLSIEGTPRLARQGDSVLVQARVAAAAQTSLVSFSEAAAPRTLFDFGLDAQGVRPVAGGAIAGALWTTHEGGLWWTRSTDGVHFPPAARAFAGKFTITGASMDEAGTFHVAAAVDGQGRYLRIPITGLATSIPLGAPSPFANPAVMAQGGRVWAQWQDHAAGDITYAMESTNGGSTFGAPYIITPRTRDAANFAGGDGLAVFADGRPVAAYLGATEIVNGGPASTNVYAVPIFEPSPRADLAHQASRVPIVVFQREAPPPMPIHELVGEITFPEPTFGVVPLQITPELTAQEGEPGTRTVPAPPATLAVGAGAALALAFFRRYRER